jgi:hypothetical protein
MRLRCCADRTGKVLFLQDRLSRQLCITETFEFCITAEKWFASGESNVFRLSRDYVNGLPEIMITAGRPLSGKDF